MSARATRAGAALALAWAVLALGCGAPARFALRAPLWRDTDDRPFSPAPAEDEEQDIANAVDVMVLRPVARTLLFETAREAHDVNSLDEVPSSTWFENRTLAPAELERGPCTGIGPTPPLLVLRNKTGGATPGFLVEDALGHRFMLKIDGLASQPEINTAADVIVSRLYWAIGFNAPCNEVIYVRREELALNEQSIQTTPTGGRRPLTAARLDHVLERATRRADGAIRLSASRFIEGTPIGTWRGEGVRADDPNDVIPHEDRRELRGERFLAAWVGHWDSRGPNTFDAYVEAPGGGGYVRHYFLDFADSLGAVPDRTPHPEPRMGHATVVNLPEIVSDAVTFGLVRRAWDDVRADRRAPNLGFFDVEHFSPLGFAPQTPLVRWERAQPGDLAWMARRIARLGPAHVRAAVAAGRLSDAAEHARLVEVLLGRRARILRTAFDLASPIANLEMRGSTRVCGVDLGVSTWISEPREVSYAVLARVGAELNLSSVGAVLTRASRGRLCVELPPTFAPEDVPRSAPDRYATLEIARLERGRRTVLRAHFYDLGPSRGYVLAGVERP